MRSHQRGTMNPPGGQGECHRRFILALMKDKSVQLERQGIPGRENTMCKKGQHPHENGQYCNWGERGVKLNKVIRWRGCNSLVADIGKWSPRSKSTINVLASKKIKFKHS